MKNITRVNYFQKIMDALPIEQFGRAATKILDGTDREMEAFWSILSAGYPTSFAISNYKNLLNYVQNKNINYSEALSDMYHIYPGLEAGIRINYPEWFKLN